MMIVLLKKFFSSILMLIVFPEYSFARKINTVPDIPDRNQYDLKELWIFFAPSKYKSL